MKTAIIIAYTLIVVLIVVAVMQWQTIKKLTPAVPPAPGDAQKRAADGSAPFGDMIAAVKDQVKSLEIKAEF